MAEPIISTVKQSKYGIVEALSTSIGTLLGRARHHVGGKPEYINNSYKQIS